MFFLYRPDTSATGRILGRALGDRWGTSRIYELRSRTSPLIRWGNSDPVLYGMEEINTAEAIRLASNKLRSLEVMRDAGVPVIPFSLNGSDTEGTVFGRSRYHTRGSDIRIYDEDAINLGLHDFYTEYIEPRHEYRIHVMGGEVIRSQIKVPTDTADPNGMIRNRANGWIMNGMNSTRPNQDRLDAAIAAVEALGLDFGAVDLLVGREDNAPYVLEVNTAPRCDATTGTTYVEAFVRLASEMGVACTPRYEALEALRDRS